MSVISVGFSAGLCQGDTAEKYLRDTATQAKSKPEPETLPGFLPEFLSGFFLELLLTQYPFDIFIFIN